MNNKIKVYIALTLLAIQFAACTPLRVRVQPQATIAIRPLAPTPRHVWVANGYTRQGRRYVPTNGYWTLPQRGRSVYVQGYWQSTRRGNSWVPGYWR